MTIAPLKNGYTKDQFTDYVNSVVANQMKVWRPRGCVLHNTFLPNLAMVDDYLAGTNVHGRNAKLKKWTFDQLIDNWWQSYIKMKWAAGPHLFINRDKIWTATPLWMKETHSPSYNSTHWGIEMVGDFDTEAFPDDIRDNTIHAMACLYAMVGHSPADQPDGFHRHGDDPRTSHKNCYGKNAGLKSTWIKAIKERMAVLHDGEHTGEVQHADS